MSRPAVGVQVWGAGAAALTARARQVEELGFDAVSVPDHLVALARRAAADLRRPGPGDVARARADVGAEQRPPPPGACWPGRSRRWPSCRGGRFELGLGAGHAKEEYDRDRDPVRSGPGAGGPDVRVGADPAPPPGRGGGHVRGRALPADRRAHRAGAGRSPVRILLGGNSRAVHACAAQHADVARAHRLRAARPRRAGGDRRLQPGRRSSASSPGCASWPGRASRSSACRCCVQHYEVTDERDAPARAARAEYGLSRRGPVRLALRGGRDRGAGRRAVARPAPTRRHRPAHGVRRQARRAAHRDAGAGARAAGRGRLEGPASDPRGVSSGVEPRPSQESAQSPVSTAPTPSRTTLTALSTDVTTVLPLRCGAPGHRRGG